MNLKEIEILIMINYYMKLNLKKIYVALNLKHKSIATKLFFRLIELNHLFVLGVFVVMGRNSKNLILF